MPLVLLTQCQIKKAASSETGGLAFHNWASTPPMGWNSWDCYGPTAVENEVKANTDYMAERGEPRMTGFTKDEQYTLMSLFAIFGSPLMLGGDQPGNDELTLSLLTNKDVPEVDQHRINQKQLFRKNDLIGWTADDPKTGDKYLAVFNASDSLNVMERDFTEFIKNIIK